MTPDSKREEIDALVRKHAAIQGPLSEQTDLCGEHGMCVFDLEDLLEEFAERFAVDLSGYLWYFHSDEEGVSPGRWFFPAPQDRVTRIPLQLGLLYRAAELGRWPVEYPEHSLPARRWDTVINQCLVAAIVLSLVWRLVE